MYFYALKLIDKLLMKVNSDLSELDHLIVH